MLLNLKAIEAWVKDLHDAVESGDATASAQCALKLSSRRAARELTNVPDDFLVRILKSMDPIKAGRVIGYLPPMKGTAIIESMPAGEASTVLARIPTDHAIDLLQRLDEDRRETLMASLDADTRREWEAMRQYDPESTGMAMTTEFLVIPAEATVQQALDAIASAPPEIEKSSYIYIVNDEGHPLGVASVRDLVRARRTDALSAVMTGNLIAANTTDPAVEAARLLRNRRYAMLPVVDAGGVLVGVLTLDDAADILAREVADQFSGIGGDTGDESFFTRPMGAVSRRLPWMAGNVFLNLIAVAVITGFEDTIAQVAILAAFLPMITDMGGNVGIQSLSVAIRSIALGEAQIRDVRKAVWKELAVGACNGLVLGALFGVIAFAMRGRWLLGLVAGTALGANVVVAGVVGGCLPFLIKRMGKDPAMMTGPLLTTITDVTGVTIYLGLSTLFIVQLAA